MVARARLFACLALIGLAACEKKSPPAPPVVDPGGTETIRGNERLGWDQRAGDTVELAAIRYAIYVDGVRAELTGAACTPPAAAAGFPCSAPIPRLSAGAHTLELASFIVDGATLESARSAPLRVNVVATVTESETTITTSEGGTLRGSLVADDLIDPSDLAFAPDGRVFVAERGGTVRSVPGARDRAMSGELLAIALDPDFARTRHVYAISASRRTSGDPVTFELARFRESSGTFGDRVVLLDRVRAAAPNPSASLRIGPDRKLYAAFDAGGDADAAQSPASLNGKVVRLNLDGTTPDDQIGAAPVFASGFQTPRGLDWQPASGTLWIADARAPLTALEIERDAARAAVRAVVRRRFPLPRTLEPASMAFVRDGALANSLLIASGGTESLLRVRFDGQDPSRVVATEPLLDSRLGALRVVAAAPDGSIYLATSRALYRLTP